MTKRELLFSGNLKAVEIDYEEWSIIDRSNDVELDYYCGCEEGLIRWMSDEWSEYPIY